MTLERSLTDIDSILKFAKLENSDLKPVIQSIHFSNQLENDSLKILELDNSVLKSLHEGECVEIRGESGESAVLVTDNQTFDLKEAETSNSLLLLPNLSFETDLQAECSREIVKKEVVSVIHNYYELRLIKPKLKKLRSLLEENVYRGRECEGDEQDIGNKYTLLDLLSNVQASNKEIQQALTNLFACEINGFWRLLDFEYLTTVLHHVTQLCEENDWFQTGVPVLECCQALQELFQPNIVQHVIKSFAKIEDGSNMETDSAEGVVFLCENKVCKHFAELCLKHSGKFNLNDFLQTWQESVPDGMTTSVSQIEGMALIDRDSRPSAVWYYSVEDLPENVADRFESLFEARSKWSLDDITPYVRDLTDDKTDVGALLTKHARASMQNGIKMFSSRKSS